MPRHEITKKAVVYRIDAMDRVAVRRGIVYRNAEPDPLTMDVYSPPDATSGARVPAVLSVIGYSDIGARRVVGCAANEMESFISWAKLTAASGIVAITYSTGVDPAADVDAVLGYVRQNASSLGVDEDRIGVWACSGHAPNALSLLMHDHPFIRCAVLHYAMTLDLVGSTGVADAAKTIRFANASAGRTVDDLPAALPLFVSRAGQDTTPALNDALERFVRHAIARNLPITFVNHATGPHAFDLMDDSEVSRDIIRQTLAFMQLHLLKDRR